MEKLTKLTKGITLIALVVTIIVLLILAGIAINLTIGNNGLFKRAEDAVTESRGGEVEEAKELWKTDKLLAKYGGNEGESLEELLTRLLENKKITEEEKKEIEETGEVKIGSRTIIFLDDSEKIDEYEYYCLNGEPWDEEHLFLDLCHFNFFPEKYEYVLKKTKNIEKPRDLTDEEIAMMFLLPEEFRNMTWEECINKAYEEVQITKKYATYKEFFLEMEEGATEEEYNKLMKDIRASEEYKAYMQEELSKYEEEITEMRERGVDVIYDEDLFHTYSSGLEVPAEEAKYTFALRYEGQEFNINITINQYEILAYAGKIYALDVRNKKALKINKAKVIVDGNEVEIDNENLVDEGDHNYLKPFSQLSGFEDRVYLVILECDEGTLEGYVNYYRVT